MEGRGARVRGALDCSVSDVLMKDWYGWWTCARRGPSGERDDCLRLCVCAFVHVRLGDMIASLKEWKDVMHVKRHQPAQRNQRPEEGEGEKFF